MQSSLYPILFRGPRFPQSLGSNLIAWWNCYQTGQMSLLGTDVMGIGSLNNQGIYTPPTTAPPDGSRAPNLVSNATVFTSANNDILIQSPPLVYTTLTSSTTLPDGASGSTSGKGFPCTGLCRVASVGWLVGNFSSPREGDPVVTPSAVLLSDDFSTIIQETLLSSFPGSATTGVQGVCAESATSAWISSNGDNKLYNFNPQTGAYIGVLTSPLSGTNGLAYDSVNDQLIVSDVNGKIQWINKSTAAVIRTVYIGDGTSNFDQLCFDATNSRLLITQGINRGVGKVYFIDLTTYTPVAIASLTSATAIEGVALYGGDMYIANDAYYHNDPSDLNQIFRYTINSFPSPPPAPGTRFTIAGLFKQTATYTGARCIFQVGDPLENTAPGNGVGIYTVANVTSSLSVFASKAAGAGNRSSANVACETSTDVILLLDFNMTAGTVTARVNGVQGSALALSNVTGGSISNARAVMGSALEAGAQTRRSDPTVAGGFAIIANGYQYSEKIEAALAWGAGKTSLLPTSNPWKYTPPY